MKIVNLIKKTPFIFTLFIIILVSISNQKQNTRLKILIWNTPSLSLGTYLAISTGTGYIISYIVTRNLAKVNKIDSKRELKYKLDDEVEGKNENKVNHNEISYDNTFIERDVKDPSPTINASFRIIGRGNESLQNDHSNRYYSSETSTESEYEYNEQEINYNNEKELISILDDWEDDSYKNW